MKKLSIWLNAIANAWNMGEAPWAYDERGAVAVNLWCRVFRETNDEVKATDAVVTFAEDKGIDPKRHRWHGKR